MIDSSNPAIGNCNLVQALPFYYGWMHVGIAAVAMTATLPGRTHGLGLITEPLLADFGMTAVSFARINFISALVGAAACLPIGWWIDRSGVRVVLTTVTFALGASVIAMSRCETVVSLAVTLTLVRGLGQSALSLVSLSVVSKWFERRLGIAMGAFAVLLTFGFIASVMWMGSLIEETGWRSAWATLGWSIAGLSVPFAILTRSTPESCGLVGDRSSSANSLRADGSSRTIRDALRSPAFWVLVLGSSMFNFVWSGVTLFNESILRDRGIDAGGAAEVMAILAGVGLIANIACGSLATRGRILKLMSVGLGLLAAGLFWFPWVTGVAGARWYAVAIGSSGGVVTVVFFAAWRHLFGSVQLGMIQGAAQFATVLASASGPVVIALAADYWGGYHEVFTILAVATACLAIIAFFVPTEPAENSFAR